MGIEAKILADSIYDRPDAPRLTTFEICFPRPFLAEFNTHRVFSRNSASSRAIPVEKMITRAMEDPYIPSSWGKNQKGMQAGVDVDDTTADKARDHWLLARDAAVERAKSLLSLGIHKQLTNRLLEPWLWHTCIVTATEWSNFFHLRNNAMAQPEIQSIARMMQQLYRENEPKKLQYGQWHLPLLEDTELYDNLSDNAAQAVQISTGRCARVSYLTHDGKRDPAEDIRLYNDLLEPGHMSPFEHVARPMAENIYDEPDEIDIRVDINKRRDNLNNVDRHDLWCGNFAGWVQHRKTISGESDILAYRKKVG